MNMPIDAARDMLDNGSGRLAPTQGVALPGDDVSLPPPGFGGPTVSVLQAPPQGALHRGQPMTIETLDATIAQLQAETRRVEHMPPTIAERTGTAEARLREAEDIYRRFGLGDIAGDPREAAHLRQQALLGAINSAALLKVERQRIEAQGEGLSAPAKAERLAQLRRQIERLASKRELAVREIEGDGFMVQAGAS